MWHHIYLFGEPTAKCWAWVEYFFILTGYFTMAHFQKHIVIENAGKEAIRYTFYKFSSFLPYVFISVFVRYLFDSVPLLLNGDPISSIYTFLDFPFESMLLTSSGIASARLESIWYLSALFIVMPLFSWLLIKLRSSWQIWSVLIPVLYYGKMGINVDRTPINDILRAFVGITLGSAVYYAVEWIKNIKHNYPQQIFLTFLEVFTLGISIYITVYNKSYKNLLLISFSALAILVISGVTYSSVLHGRWCTFLARISLPMYLFHWNVALFLNYFSFDVKYKLILYYVCTFFISALAVISESKIRKILEEKHLRQHRAKSE